jgi:DNA polymerase
VTRGRPTPSVLPDPAAVEAAVAADPARAGHPDELARVAEIARGCRACDLWARATQTVFGLGPVPARLMLVGEQPGDQEDLAGEPFVGPAGQLLDRALDEAGIDRETVFVTNVVKHFKWKPIPGSKRRLHDKPNRVEVSACLPWVETELALVRPEALVLLGATAANALLGPEVRVTRDRGRAYPSNLAPLVVPTIHPSAVLRSRDSAERDRSFASLVADLATVREALGSARRAAGGERGQGRARHEL